LFVKLDGFAGFEGGRVVFDGRFRHGGLFACFSVIWGRKSGVW
jgi:hypothetical protein